MTLWFYLILIKTKVKTTTHSNIEFLNGTKSEQPNRMALYDAN